MLLVLITLTRGLGQSALSVVSLAMPGKWFRRRLTWAMGVYALVTSVGFMLAFPATGALVQARGWRVAWAAIGCRADRGSRAAARGRSCAGSPRATSNWKMPAVEERDDDPTTTP